MIVACYHRLAKTCRTDIPCDTGGETHCHRCQFDRPLVKCYKSAFCAAFAPRHRGASPAIFGGSLQPARGRFFLVECEQFALRSRQTALSRKSVPEAAVPASNCPVNK